MTTETLGGKAVLVTGASGFIGARLCQILSSAYRMEVRALAHRPGTAGTARLACLKGVRIFFGDVRDRPLLEQAAEGCRYVVHAATGKPGPAGEQQSVTVDGAQAALAAALRARARRFVHFSTASVVDPEGRTKTVVEEDRPDPASLYAEMKVRAESLVIQEASRSGLPYVILRPTCVWGPFSPIWTLAAAKLIRTATPFLPDEGRGAANAVYIDNLVDALVLCLADDRAAGKTFFVNDDFPESWADLYGGYASALGAPLAPCLLESNAKPFLRRVLNRALSSLRDRTAHLESVKYIWGLLPDSTKNAVKHNLSLSQSTAALYTARCRYSNSALKRLGWQPRIGFDEAMRRTGDWLSYIMEGETK